MKNRYLFITTILILQLGMAFAGSNAADEALRQELLEMQRIDQEARRAKDIDAMRAADQRNRPRLKGIVERYGWPTVSLVGEDGALAAWLVAQHSDEDPTFQTLALSLMEPLVAQREASGKLFAYLYDRTHKPQRYGTQGSCTGPALWTPREIEEPDRVDERRALVGMEPAKLAEYAKMVGTNACK